MGGTHVPQKPAARIPAPQLMFHGLGHEPIQSDHMYGDPVGKNGAACRAVTTGPLSTSKASDQASHFAQLPLALLAKFGCTRAFPPGRRGFVYMPDRSNPLTPCRTSHGQSQKGCWQHGNQRPIWPVLPAGVWVTLEILGIFEATCSGFRQAAPSDPTDGIPISGHEAIHRNLMVLESAQGRLDQAAGACVARPEAFGPYPYPHELGFSRTTP